MEAETQKPTGRGVGLSAAFCRMNATEAPAGFLDAEYFDDVYGAAFRDGAIAEAPVLPGTGMFLPAGSAAGKDKGLFRLKAPEFIADLCTGCMECALACPDAAIPNSVHDIRDLIVTAIAPARHRREAAREAARPRSGARRRGAGSLPLTKGARRVP